MDFRICFLGLFWAPLFCCAQHWPHRAAFPPELREVSGLLVKGQELIAVNDNDNAPVLFRASAEGRILQKIAPPGLENIDWEELASDGAGRIFIGDFGNNLNERRDLRIVVFDERSGQTSVMPFEYEDQTQFPPPSKSDWAFDCEAMVFLNDTLHLFSKNHWTAGDFSCKHYVLPIRPGSQKAVLREKIELRNRVVSGAALSPDGRFLALIGYRFGRRWSLLPYAKATVFLFEGWRGSDFFSGTMRRRKPPYFLFARQWEAIQFISERRLLLASERLRFFKPGLRSMRLKRLGPDRPLKN